MTRVLINRQEALMRIKAEGVTQKLVGVVLDGDEVIPSLPDVAPIFRDGKEIGKVTLILWSPRMQKNIGFVWVPIQLAGPGNSIEVSTLHGTVPGKTAAVPFFDPRKSVAKPETFAAVSDVSYPGSRLAIDKDKRRDSRRFEQV